MAYRYLAYNTKGEVVKGKLSASNDEAATELLTYAGYQVINLKPYTPFFNPDNMLYFLYQVKTPEVVLFFRQLAMLLESGTNMGASIEMLQLQTANRLFKKVLGDVVSDIRGGSQMSISLSKHPKIFSPVYCQLIGVGEQSGDLEALLRQVADYMEKEEATVKQTKGALMMPGITAVIATLVIGLLITFVLPSFGTMYESLGAELPPIAKSLIALGEGVKSNGVFVLLGLAAIIGSGVLYIKTPKGRYNWDLISLKMPLMGRVKLLSELSRCCRSMSLLFKAGMPLNEALPLVIKGCGNKVLATSLEGVLTEMVKGEGLSMPMSKNKLFLPMMVQMVKVGEETGRLDTTLQAVAQSYEAEAEDKIHSLIALIQPAMTVIIGGVVGLIAVTLMSAMTSMYGEGF
ncbi:type II secretion system F family protein [Chloroflexota bacterium]